MVNIFYLFFQFGDILIGEPLGNDHCKGTGSKIIHQNVLTYHCFNILWQVREDIVIDSRAYVSKKGRDQKHQTDDENDKTAFYNTSAKFVHNFPHLFL